MATHIKSFPDGSSFEYDRGSFDEWCVYIKPRGTRRYAPKDIDYLTELSRIGSLHGCTTIYNDFVIIFENTTKELDQSLLDNIRVLSEKYGCDAAVVDKLLTLLYASMVAEENKARTKLGKKVKRLAVHQVLKENMKPDEAAAFSKGRTWQSILKEYDGRIQASAS